MNKLHKDISSLYDDVKHLKSYITDHVAIKDYIVSDNIVEKSKKKKDVKEHFQQNLGYNIDGFENNLRQYATYSGR